MARFNIEIGAVNTELKKALTESNKLLKQFQKNAQSIKVNIGGGNKRSVDSLNNSLKQTDTLLKSIAKSSSAARTNLRGVGGTTSNVSALQKEREELAKLRTQAQAYRTEAAKVRTEITKLRLTQQQNRTQTTAAAGSYREAQQRLTALGRSIREAQNGFTRMTPAVRAQIEQYRALNAQLTRFDKSMGLNFRNIGNYGSALGALSPQLSLLTGTMGGFVAAGLLVRDVTKTIRTFDAGMRNVEKTTGLTRKEIDRLGDEFVKLSRRLQTVSSNDLTQYATVAGQLGVKGTQNILAFTEALAKLETATNISGEQGGAEIARTLTLIEGGVQNVAKFGDEIVNLGNNFAATESEILGNAQAIAQNTTIYGFARQEVLGYAAASKALGIQQEIVGSTFQKTLGTFEAAIRTGKGLDEILKVVGGSAEELGVRFQEDAAGVLQDYIKGLNGIVNAGGSVMEQMQKNGIVDIRQRRVIGTLATGYDTLARSMDTVRDSADALDTEFETKAGSIVNQTNRIKIAWDNLMLSIENGTGAIGKISTAFAGVAADVLESLTGLVTSDSWKEFFLRISGSTFGVGTGLTKTIANANAELVRIRNEQEKADRADPNAPVVRRFEGMSLDEQTKELELQRQSLNLLKQEYETTKGLMDFKYYQMQQDLVERLTKSHNELKEVKAESTEPTEEEIELTKEQLRLIEQQKKERERLENTVRKLQEENHLNHLKGYDREIQAIKYRYDEEIKQAKGANDIIQALQLQRIAAISQAIQASGTLTPSLQMARGFGRTEYERQQATAGQLVRGPSSLPSANLQTQQPVITPDFDLSLITQGLRRASRKFVNNMSSSLEWLHQTETKRFGDYLLGIGQSIFSSFDSIINNTLANQLEDMIQGVFDDIKDGISGGADWSKIGQLGVGLGGQLIQGATKKTNVLGQTLGGLASGAAAGASGGWVGAIVGAVVGGLSGLFSASSARRQEKLQEQQLEEQKKQTALMERQAALAYTSQIIGQMTSQGLVQGVSRNEFGDIVFRIQGRDLVGVINKEEAANMRGV